MTFTYDPSTDPGRVRLLLSDVDQATAVFTDEEIAAFLTLEGGSVKRAAAQAIDTNATNEVLASKVLTDHQLSTNGAAVANAMRAHATTLREQAELDAERDDFFFDVVDLDPQPVWSPAMTSDDWPC